MKVTVNTNYDLPAMKALARGLRKTVRKKRSCRSHLLGWIVVVLGAILLLSASEINGNFVVTALAVAAIVLTFCFEDTLNGMIAIRRGVPGLRSAVTEFDENSYFSKTEVGESRFPYDNICRLVETKNYFLLIIGPNHGQVYSKAGISIGNEEKFKTLLEEKTVKSLKKCKITPDQAVRGYFI